MLVLLYLPCEVYNATHICLPKLTLFLLCFSFFFTEPFSLKQPSADTPPPAAWLSQGCATLTVADAHNTLHITRKNKKKSIKTISIQRCRVCVCVRGRVTVTVNVMPVQTQVHYSDCFFLLCSAARACFPTPYLYNSSPFIANKCVIMCVCVCYFLLFGSVCPCTSGRGFKHFCLFVWRFKPPPVWWIIVVVHRGRGGV